MHTWRFIDSGTASAQWNMAVDEALLSAYKENDLPILRLYRWEEPSLSLGRFSHFQETLQLQKTQSSGVAYVRRITGGGILVHGGDISYSLIVPRSFVQKKGVRNSYRYLCGFLIKLYRDLGLDAGFAYDLQIPETKSPICLAGTEAYDIIIGGRKIGGNAQRHTRQALLQHGSIPLRLDKERFEALFSEDSGLSLTNTLDTLQIDMTEERLSLEIQKAFNETLGTIVQTGSLSAEELMLAERLFKEKYSQEAWNVHAKNTLQQT
ncbi:hypothetical protein AS592_07320 [Sulfurovum riftiae]|uniref:BPL/LPL catalytic domain-containing protein n=2 Tax=Sulfurovum riftiae TaxID=1630136 RepID=A0A151CH68_9BACT|nr:hypothetical protein AS592_07320 [Sulfurovum riftiae]